MESTEALLWEPHRICGKVGSALDCGHSELSFKMDLAALASAASSRLSARLCLSLGIKVFIGCDLQLGTVLVASSGCREA